MSEKKMLMQVDKSSIDAWFLKFEIDTRRSRKVREDALLDCLDRISDQDLVDYLDMIGADDGEEDFYEEALRRTNRDELSSS